jgi:acid phosphatase
MPEWTRKARLIHAASLMIALLGASCGGTAERSFIPNPPPPSSHVFVVLEENHSYSDVIGNSAMPYLNGLASKYAVATQYFANVHPSLPNYFVLTTGKTEATDDAFTGIVSDDNIVRELGKANKTWRSYAESLPNAGYLGGDIFPYAKHHNPFAYFSDVVGTMQAGNVVPFSQFSADLANDSLPDFSFILPNLINDAHDGTLATADQWLAANIDPLIRSNGFQQNGLLIVVFDESDASDMAHGGGHVPMIIVGPQVKSGYQSTTFYQHESTLRVVLSTLGVTSFPGATNSAPDMGEFFK